MMGIGWAEFLILLVIGLLTVVPGVLGVGVLIWLLVRRNSSSIGPSVRGVDMERRAAVLLIR
jgi:hypothetical protein